MKVIRNLFLATMMIMCMYILLICTIDLKIPVWAIVIFIFSAVCSLVSGLLCLYKTKRK